MPDSPGMDQPQTRELSASDIQLIVTALKFLLEAEGDADQIEEIKLLIGRLDGGHDGRGGSTT